MYPDWPESAADLVPLPRVNGPKLAPFDFRGPQKIEFLEHLGEGTHSHVLKVRILGQIYALKLVSVSANANKRKGADICINSSDSSTITTGRAPDITSIAKTARQ
jgi:hypothetical protein